MADSWRLPKVGILLLIFLASCNSIKIKYNTDYYYCEKANGSDHCYNIIFVNDSVFNVSKIERVMHLCGSICNMGNWKCNSKDKLILKVIPFRKKIKIDQFKVSESLISDSTYFLISDRAVKKGLSLFYFINDSINFKVLEYKKQEIILPFKIDSFYLQETYGCNFISRYVYSKSDIIKVGRSDSIFVSTQRDTCNNYPIFDSIEFKKNKLIEKKLVRCRL